MKLEVNLGDGSILRAVVRTVYDQRDKTGKPVSQHEEVGFVVQLNERRQASCSPEAATVLLAMLARNGGAATEATSPATGEGG